MREILQALGIAIAGLIFAMGAVYLVAVLAGVSLSDAQILGIGLIFTLVFDCALFGIAVAFTVGKHRLHWGALGFRDLALDRMWIPVATVVTTFAILAVYGIIIQLLGLDDLIPESSLEEDIFDNRALVVAAGILAIVAAPIAEETFFRGFVFSGLVTRLGFIGAAFVSGFLFSLAHAQLATLIPFTLVGMLFAGVYVYAGSLWASIGAHLIYNLISFTIVLGGWGQ